MTRCEMGTLEGCLDRDLFSISELFLLMIPNRMIMMVAMVMTVAIIIIIKKFKYS